MKKIIIFLSLIVGQIHNNNISAQIIPDWATTYSYNYPMTINQNDMVIDNNGNIYITGYTYDTSYNSNNIITLKYNSSGQLQWIQQYDSINYYSKIAVDDSGNVYVGGHSAYDLLTIKYSSLGVFQWVKSYAGSQSYNWVFDIITDDSCNVYITGNSHGDRFTTIKYSSSGNLLWIALDGPAGGLSNYYISLDNNNNVYIVARGYDTLSSFTCNTIKYNSYGVKQWEKIYHGNFNPGLAGPRGIKFDSNGFIYILASTTNNNNGEGDYAVVKYDTLGNEIWSSSYSFTSYYDVPKSMEIDKSGNVYVTGNIWPSGGGSDSIATVKLNKIGSFEWARTYSLGYSGLDEASDIAIDSLGYIYVVGKSSDVSHYENFVTIKYDSLGNEIWISRYQNTVNSSDAANSVGLDNLGNVYVSGTSRDLNSSGILTIKYSNTVGIEDFSIGLNTIVNVFPNPFVSSLTIKVNKELKNAVLIIYDVIGKEALKITNIDSQIILLKRGSLAAGIYFFRLLEKDQDLASGKISAQ